jgi:LAGLIDADG DNA endonuclease family
MTTLNYIVRLYRTSAKSELALTQQLQEVLFGCMLGDLHAEKPSPKHNTRLQFKQGLPNALYLMHLFCLMQTYCGSAPIWLSWFDNRPNKLKIYHSIKFQTLSLPCFNFFRELFYNLEGIKVVPVNIGDHFTAVSLAYWYIDDGYKGVQGYYLCTESFSANDISVLLDMLRIKFGLQCGIHNTTNGARIYIQTVSVGKFNKWVAPYIIESFKYKLHNKPFTITNHYSLPKYIVRWRYSLSYAKAWKRIAAT